MVRHFFFVMILSLNFSDTFSQKSVPENEQKRIMQLPDDTTKVDKLNDYAVTQFSNPERAIAIIENNIVLASKIKYPLGLSVAYGLRANLFFYEMKLDSSKLLLDKAYELVKEKNDDISRGQKANLFNRYAAIFQRRENYDSAVELYLRAANIFNETGDDPKIIFSYYNLSTIYKYLGDTAKTLFYASEAKRLALSTTDPSLLIRGLMAASDAYDYIKDYDSVLINSERGLKEATKENMVFAIGVFNKFIGSYYANKRTLYDSAIFHYNIALQSFDEINTQYDIALVLQNIGNAYLKKGDFINAEINLKRAIKLSKELKLDQVLYSSLIDLVTVEEKLGKTAESFLYLKQYVAISDSIENRNNKKKVYNLESKYQIQKREVQLLEQEKLIERKSFLNYLLICSVVSLSIILLLVYRNYLDKQKLQNQRINELETEKKLTATEAVLKGEEQERTRLAKDLHDGLGGMLSGIKHSFNTMKGNLIMTDDNSQAFERSMDMLDSSIKEMRRVAHNMMPESLVKFGLNTALQDFCNDIEKSGALKVSYQSIGIGDVTIEQTKAITIYRIVQELISNTMKHAGAANAIVQLSKIDEHLSVTVEDDGKGFDTSVLNASRGIGWTNIKSRVDFLKANVDIQSALGKGTSVHIELTT